FVLPPRSALDVGPFEGQVNLPAMISWHHTWAAYVTGASAEPAFPGVSVFSQDEYAHMADVRAVFHGAEIAAVLAFFATVFRVLRARSQGYALRLVRAGSVVAAAIVVGVGVAAIAVVATLFLLFHGLIFALVH